MGAAVAVLVSNAISQILLAAALIAILILRERLRLPPVGVPLALFVLGTLIALALSPDPSAGVPQVRKFYVYLLLPVLYTAWRRLEDVRTMLLVWTLLAVASGLWSFVQFWQKRSEAIATGADFYLFYVANRATGFMSHWMTFSAEQMIVALMLAALLLFGAFPARRIWAIVALVVIAGSLLIAQTRSVWLGAVIGFLYLIAVWRPKLLALTPLAGALVWFVAPQAVQERMISIYRPHGKHDSNEHRSVTFRTGLEMIKAHPWFGVGPEIPKRDFDKYVPADVKRPIPEGFYGHLHNVTLQYAAERGIPTALAFLWFLVKVIFDFARAVRGTDDRLRRAILHGAIATLFALLAESFFEHNLNDSEVLTMFLAVVASGYLAVTHKEPVNA